MQNKIHKKSGLQIINYSEISDFITPDWFFDHFLNPCYSQPDYNIGVYIYRTEACGENCSYVGLRSPHCIHWLHLWHKTDGLQSVYMMWDPKCNAHCNGEVNLLNLYNDEIGADLLSESNIADIVKVFEENSSLYDNPVDAVWIDTKRMINDILDDNESDFMSYVKVVDIDN